MATLVLLAGISALVAACGVPEHLNPNPRSIAKTAITNVHVWDGAKFGQSTSTVVFSGQIISNANSAGATIVDGRGGYLLPGFIDAHCHVTDCSLLNASRQYGITTALDMGTFPVSAVKACNGAGVTDIKGSGPAATVNGTAISHFPGYPTEDFVKDPIAGRAFVIKQVFSGVDYIKVFLDPLGPDDATLAAIVQQAHLLGKLVITHAVTSAAYAQAARAGVDLPTHVPLDAAVNAATIGTLKSNGKRSIPTLIMLQSIVNNTGAPYALYLNAAQASVTAMQKAGIPIVTGTDANVNPFVPANPPFGESLHEELALLVAAGLTNVQAIQAATSTAASAFGLYDRGAIRVGLRADAVLLSADPTVHISNSRSIKKVWVAGVEAPGL